MKLFFKSKFCLWRLNKSVDLHFTSCSNSHCFPDLARSIKFKFCPYCGKKIKELPPLRR
jgi:hypothetical protein